MSKKGKSKALTIIDLVIVGDRPSDDGGPGPYRYPV